MYSPETLIVKNIGPIKHAEYNFDDLVVLLTGENLTDEGQDSNGSGKSYILESISYATTGTSFRKVTDSELVREGEKEGYIFFVLYNSVMDRSIAVERYIYSGNKSSKLIIAINGEEQKQITSVNEGNKFILAELGLSREDILNYFMISKEKYTSFFSSSDTAKKELISRFSKANLIDEIFPKIEADKQKAVQKITEKEREILSLEARIQTLKEDSDPEKQKLIEEENNMKIEELEKQISNLLNEVSKLEKVNNESQLRVDKINGQLKEFKTNEEVNEKIKKEQFSLEFINSEIRKTRAKTKESQEILSEIEKSLMGVVECPKCNHEFNVADPDFDVEEGRLIKSELDDIITQLKSEAKEQELKVPEIEKAIRELNDQVNKQKRVLNDLEIEKSRLINNVRNNVVTIKTKENEIVIKIDRIEAFKNLEFEPNKNDSKIKESEKELSKKQVELKQLKLDSNFYDEWILNFKSFKTFLANKSLHNITNQTNLYLEKLKSSIRVKFEGYKELKSGKTKEQIDIRIFKFGEDRGSFGKLSGGEKARVEVATILALSSLINSSSDSGGLNLVIVDEILESLDSTGLKSIVKAMANINQHVMLVTHGKLDTQEGFNEIRMVKTNGISSLEKY